jgi:hypothetical protein
VGFLNPLKILVNKLQIRESQKILALQIVNPQIATHVEGPQM